MLISSISQFWTTLILFLKRMEKDSTHSMKAYVDDKGKPFQNIQIKHTHILVDPFQLSYLIPDAEIDVDVGLEEYDWGPMDEELDPVTRDLPYAEIKPRDNNVLWVCNLNSVTEDEDLYTIFSRFGTVASAEIIRLGIAIVMVSLSSRTKRHVSLA
ncbi:hypothetical protein MTR67_049854 [Solanum verrucosum]|uniref:peptidylprolyl isomerase n=1 Tax=Solanum verrucosum TaxID=315347 RepID=A0AAF0V3B9_SOLVR|nr:hypothetical protein MTR67_049854 [Solanum verrucosum]